MDSLIVVQLRTFLKTENILSLFLSQVVLGFVCEADYKVVAKAIRHRVTVVKRQREKQRRLVEESLTHRREVVIQEEAESNPANQRAVPTVPTLTASKLTNQVDKIKAGLNYESTLVSQRDELSTADSCVHVYT